MTIDINLLLESGWVIFSNRSKINWWVKTVVYVAMSYHPIIALIA